ncbi:MAG: redoxin domain-containing protein [Acidobacteria bacterium]|nr:redoxin domain-containing protein [Acidobacteriota bacterium]MBK9526750.1 redoxin domain-containing protein [Acidobacteriota bacterium]MBP7474115.1 redoxin domain-containing protein [Pyrinomonadaceae bacterium]MBP9108506.1 redoxin domain-containing protein [Pyrinomonadaceae bacterium]
MPKFVEANTKVFGISMDSRFSNAAFAEKVGVTSFQLLSDWTRDVTKDYGLYDEVRQSGRRATFVVDKEGRFQQIVLDNLAIDPTSTLEACSIMEKKLVVAPPKP